MAGWWNRGSSVEVDLVATGPKGLVAIGSIKWRERRAFDHGEFAESARARGVVPHAGAAKLVAVCPGGARAAVTPDDTLTAKDLLAAWTA